MIHVHSEVVCYGERTYSREYKHEHLFDHEAHSHLHGWGGKSKNKTQHAKWNPVIPITKTIQTTITVETGA